MEGPRKETMKSAKDERKACIRFNDSQLLRDFVVVVTQSADWTRDGRAMHLAGRCSGCAAGAASIWKCS